MPPERKRPQDDDNNDEGIKVIPFKKRDVEDREEVVKTIKILPEGTERLLCDICSASLKSQAYLDHHKETVHCKESFDCLQCGVYKSSTKRLRDHMRSHIQVVYHKCGKMVPKMHNQRHFKTCKGEKQQKVYKCQFCNFKSKWKYNTERHESNHCLERRRQHPEAVDPLTTEEASEWFSGLNVTKEDFLKMLRMISAKFGEEYVSKGTKVYFLE